MPRGDDCNHRNCDGGPCKQLTPEELEPTKDDMELAQKLVEEGWKSVSTKSRTIARLTNWPYGKDLIRPEMLDTEAGRMMERMWDDRRDHQLRMIASGNENARVHAEIRHLPLRVYRGFRKAGGTSA